MNGLSPGGRPKLVTVEEFRSSLKRVLIEKFLEVNRRLFETALKDPTWPGLSPTDLRMLVRQFAMGWAESAAVRGDAIYCHTWAEVFGIITTPDWWPSDEWRFW